MTKNVYWSARKLYILRVRFIRTLNFLGLFSKNTQISNFMKILPVGAESFLCEPKNRRTDRHVKLLFTVLRKHLIIERAVMNVSYKQRGKKDNLNNIFFRTHNNTTVEFCDIPQSLETKAATDFSRPLPLSSTSSSSFDSHTLHSTL